jgi:hypothetical protein
MHELDRSGSKFTHMRGITETVASLGQRHVQGLNKTDVTLPDG